MKALTLHRPGTFSPSVFDNALSGFDRYLDSFFRDNFLTPSEKVFDRFPAVDVRETEKSYILEAELPGYDEKDINIRLDGNNLTIESKQEEERSESPAGKAAGENTYLIHERRSSSFGRSFRLPEHADAEKISASFKNGILNLEISKRAEAQSRVIKILKD